MNKVPHTEVRPAQPALSTVRRVTMESIAEAADEIPGIMRALGSHGIDPIGPPYFRYRRIDMSGALVIEVGVPIDAETGHRPLDALLADRHDLSVGELPAGTYAVVVHKGAPSTLEEATRDLLDWGDAQGLAWDRRDTPEGEEWGCRLENYLSDPADVPDPDNWETELAFRLAD